MAALEGRKKERGVLFFHVPSHRAEARVRRRVVVVLLSQLLQLLQPVEAYGIGSSVVCGGRVDLGRWCHGQPAILAVHKQ